jgi:nicotinate-nucleotide--dimethylbenzimidazole phosphoribosyltransferase
MKNFTLANNDIQKKINSLTKPIGSLGLLEETAFKICKIQNTLTPELINPTILVYAGDHGAAKSGGISLYPQEVTYQMVMNYLAQGAAINALANMNNIEVKIIDAGVNHEFNGAKGLYNYKIDYGTKDYTREPAMSRKQCETAISNARKLTADLHKSGCNIIGCGEMGIGNTASASLLMSVFMNVPIETCTGRGTGLNDEGLKRKIEILCKVLDLHHADSNDPMDVLSKLGGFEIAMMAGTYLEAYEKGMIIMIDGFIATSALLAAHAIMPEVLENCIFCHKSDETGHKKMLEYFNASPLLSLNMRLGEGTGCAVAYPLIKASVEFLNKMASFDSAGVSKNL